MAYIDGDKVEKAKNEIVERMQAFINEYKHYSNSTEDYFAGKHDAMEVGVRLVQSVLTDVIEQPTVDVVEVERGEWLDVIEEVNNTCAGITFKGFAGYKCSLCGRQEIRKEPYCHCGAKMDGRSDTE